MRQAFFTELPEISCAESRPLCATHSRTLRSDGNVDSSPSRTQWTNNLTIRHDRLEQQLIKHLTKVSLHADKLEYAIAEFHDQFNRQAERYIREREKAQADLPKLKAELRKLDAQARNLGTAITEFRTQRSPTLLSQLSAVENRMETINRLLNETLPEIPNVPIEQVREFVLKQADNFSAALLEEPFVAKQALRDHFKPLILAPKITLMDRHLRSKEFSTFFLVTQM